MIPSSEISVVIQGPIVDRTGDTGAITREAIESVRRVLPAAEVILSTWTSADLRGLACDQVVTSEDPRMAYILGLGEAVPTNLNRLLVSTRAGLAVAKRPYALKLRTDYRLRHVGFLKYFDKYRARTDQSRVFASRVIIPDHYARNPARGARWLFHPSDVAQFGLAEDLQQFWSAPLLAGRPADLTPEEAALLGGGKSAHPVTRLYNEQYLWLSCLPDVKMRSWEEMAPDLRRASEVSLANNFVVLRRRQFGIASEKHAFEFPSWQTLYTHADWHRLYRQHCDPASPAPADPASWLKDRTQEENRSALARGLRWLLVRSEFLKGRV